MGEGRGVIWLAIKLKYEQPSMSETESQAASLMCVACLCVCSHHVCSVKNGEEGKVWSLNERIEEWATVVGVGVGGEQIISSHP